MRYIVAALVIAGLCFGMVGCNKAELEKKDAEIAQLQEKVKALEGEKETLTADLKACTDAKTAMEEAKKVTKKRRKRR